MISFLDEKAFHNIILILKLKYIDSKSRIFHPIGILILYGPVDPKNRAGLWFDMNQFFLWSEHLGSEISQITITLLGGPCFDKTMNFSAQLLHGCPPNLGPKSVLGLGRPGLINCTIK